MIFFNKLKRVGIRRAFVFSLIKIHCAVKVFLYRYLYSDNYVCIKDTKVIQATQFIGKGNISITGSQLGVCPSPGLINGCGYIEARASSAAVLIDASTIINNGFVIIADRSKISIGKRCLIGPNFFVCDSDFHGLDTINRTNGNYECINVSIEDDVFIGESVKIMKGVTVGRGAVIGSGSVVVKNVDPFSIYAGVPAHKLRSLSATHTD